jgi:hypothetical protein
LPSVLCWSWCTSIWRLKLQLELGPSPCSRARHVSLQQSWKLCFIIGTKCFFNHYWWARVNQHPPAQHEGWMDGELSGSRFLLGSSSLANHGGSELSGCGHVVGGALMGVGSLHWGDVWV